jgi:hypothetical protein
MAEKLAAHLAASRASAAKNGSFEIIHDSTRPAPSADQSAPSAKQTVSSLLQPQPSMGHAPVRQGINKRGDSADSGSNSVQSFLDVAHRHADRLHSMTDLYRS